MNYLVFLDAEANELGKILSGVKTMLIKKFDPAQISAHPIKPGDNLYFLTEKDDCALRVKAVVVRVLVITNQMEADLSHILKEMQPRLQLTEDQYNDWSERQQVLLIEFESAQKIPVTQIASHKMIDRSDWKAFDELRLIMETEE